MAMKLPNDLSANWWSDNKPKLMKKTGFGNALKAVNGAMSKFEKLQVHSKEDLLEVFEKFEALTVALGKVDSARMPKIHDDVKPVIAKYRQLIISASSSYSNRFSRYSEALREVENNLKEEKEKLKKAVTFLNAILKNYETLDGQVDALKGSDEKAKNAVKIVEDLKAKALKHKSIVASVGRDVPKMIDDAGISPNDLSRNADLMSITNAVSLFHVRLGEIESEHRKLVARLGG